MRQYPADKYDLEELERLRPEPWMVELLKLNPDYVLWGPDEDYMWVEGKGFNSRINYAGWKNFDLHLDDLNECVNFYFKVARASKACPDCSYGYNPPTDELARTFYEWGSNVTQDEVNALVEARRLNRMINRLGRRPTADEVNAAPKGVLHDISYDAIDRGVLARARANRLGVYGVCPSCEGHMRVYTEPAAHVSLILWILHPRKGASRGVEVSNIEQEDLPSVYSFLATAATRNANRFQKVVDLNAKSI